jgi:site-specific DNA recombinase
MRRSPAGRRSGSMPREAVGYVRVSTEEQAREGVSLEAQEQRLRAYATAQGLTLATVYRDEGVSGGKAFVSRPAGRKLQEAIGRGRVSHVLALKLDRLFRDAIDCMSTATAWDGAGVSLVLLDMGGSSVDSRSAAGRFMFTVLAAAAEMERNRIRERTRDALHHKREKGERLGTTPLGFRTPAPGERMEPDPVELETVRLILERREARDSFRAIAAELERRGIPTKRGRRWDHSTVRQVWERREHYRPHLAPARERLAPVCE